MYYGYRLIPVLLGCLLIAGHGWAAKPIIAAEDNERILLRQNAVEMVVPVPAGYVTAHPKKPDYKRLPVLHERNLVAVLEQHIDKSNEYQVTPEAVASRPLYYLIYVPRLDYAAASSEDLVAYLGEYYAVRGFELVGPGQRYAIHKPDDNSLSITWVQAEVSVQPEDAEDPKAVPLSANCIHTAVYRKDSMVLMFDTIEDCGINANSVKANGEAWLQRIRSANEPLPYIQRLLAEKELLENDLEADAQTDEELSDDTAEPAASDDDDQETAEAGESQSSLLTLMLWLLAGVLLGIVLWNLFLKARQIQ